MSVRSGRVWGPTDLSASVGAELFTVPSGRTLVIRTLSFDVHSGTARNIFIGVDSGAGYVESARWFAVGPNATLLLDQWRALNEGDIFCGYASAASTVTLTVYGALLEGTEPELPL